MTERALVQWLRQNDNFLILTHVRPDGDTLGCASALCLALNKLGKTAYLLRNPGDIRNFEGYLTFQWAPDDYMPDHVIAVDIATGSLLPQGGHQAYRGRVEVCVDHHVSNDGYAGSSAWTPVLRPAGRSSSGSAASWGYWMSRSPGRYISPSPPIAAALSTLTPRQRPIGSERR